MLNPRTKEFVDRLKKLKRDKGGEYHHETDGDIPSRQIIALVDLLVEEGIL